MSTSFSCGIDFGTTNSTVSIVQEGVPRALDIDPQNHNPRTLKSIIYLNSAQQPLVGKSAINQYLWDVQNIPSKPPRIVNTGRQIKIMGPSTASGVGPPIWVPEIIEVDDSGRGRLLQSLKSVLTSDSFTGTNLFDKFYSLEDLLTLLLSEIKHRAENFLGTSLESVVLGRPVRYVGQDKESLALGRMEKIAQLSGFKRVEFEYEPVGAALHYGLDLSQKQNVLVFDFGGGTLDVCIMTFPDKKVISVSGRPVGGDLLNSYLVQGKLLKYFGHDLPYFHSAMTNWYKITLLKNVKDLESLDRFILKADDPKPLKNLKKLIVDDLGYQFFNRVDKAKIRLSSKEKTIFRSPVFSIRESITRGEFEFIIQSLVDDSVDCINESLAYAQLKSSDIDTVLVTGGSSKIPIFLDLIKNTFPWSEIITGNRYTAVALGLSLKAKSIFG